MRINLNALRDIERIYDDLLKDGVFESEFMKAMYRDFLLSDIRRTVNYLELNEMDFLVHVPGGIRIRRYIAGQETERKSVRCRVSKGIVKGVELKEG